MTPLRFADGSPVRGASAIARFGDGWLVVQDDATHACWLPAECAGPGRPLRLLPAVEGHEAFSEAARTKQLKPDLEAAVPLDDGVLLLGSGSLAARMRSVLMEPERDPVIADLTPVYVRIADVLGVGLGQLNLEGACVVDGALRWFQRGLPASGLPTASVEVGLQGLLEACRGEGERIDLDIGQVHRYDLTLPRGPRLAVTDAVALPESGILVSAAAEDSPNAYDDGAVVASGLAILDGEQVQDIAPLPELGGRIAKVEGLAILDWSAYGGRLLATVDADDPDAPSSLLTLEVR